MKSYIKMFNIMTMCTMLAPFSTQAMQYGYYQQPQQYYPQQYQVQPYGYTQYPQQQQYTHDPYAVQQQVPAAASYFHGLTDDELAQHWVEYVGRLNAGSWSSFEEYKNWHTTNSYTFPTPPNEWIVNTNYYTIAQQALHGWLQNKGYTLDQWAGYYNKLPQHEQQLPLAQAAPIPAITPAPEQEASLPPSLGSTTGDDGDLHTIEQVSSQSWPAPGQAHWSLMENTKSLNYYIQDLNNMILDLNPLPASAEKDRIRKILGEKLEFFSMLGRKFEAFAYQAAANQLNEKEMTSIELKLESIRSLFNSLRDRISRLKHAQQRAGTEPEIAVIEKHPMNWTVDVFAKLFTGGTELNQAIDKFNQIRNRLGNVPAGPEKTAIISKLYVMRKSLEQQKFNFDELAQELTQGKSLNITRYFNIKKIIKEQVNNSLDELDKQLPK